MLDCCIPDRLVCVLWILIELDPCMIDDLPLITAFLLAVTLWH